MTTKDILFGWMLQQIDKPYEWGGTGWPGYDCSGLVQDFDEIIGIDPSGDQTAAELHNYWWNQIIKRKAENLQKNVITFGTHLFFSSQYDRDHVTHVAIAVNKTIMFEAGGGNRHCKTPDDAEEQNARVRFRRIDSRKDFLCAIRPYQFANAIMEGS